MLVGMLRSRRGDVVGRRCTCASGMTSPGRTFESRKAVKGESGHLFTQLPRRQLLTTSSCECKVSFCDESLTFPSKRLNRPQCSDQHTPVLPPTALRSIIPSLNMSRLSHSSDHPRFQPPHMGNSSREDMGTNNRHHRVKGTRKRAILCIQHLEAS